MSKSVGNIIEPTHAINGNSKNKLPQSGLDTLRFWVAHEYYKPQIQIGGKILEKFIKRVFEIRSLLRFMVGNLNDFSNLDKYLINYESLEPIDKYILGRLRETFILVEENYYDMHFNKALNILENFFLSELSSFYIKSIKDRLYCDDANSLTRRSAQTTLYNILKMSLLMIGPIMPHLAEEAFHYSVLKQNQNDSSLFRSDYSYTVPQEWNNQAINQKFELIFSVRDKFFEQLKTENAALYDITLECDKNAYDLLAQSDRFSDYFGCASVKIKLVNDATSNTDFVQYVLKDGKMYSCLLTKIKTENLSCNRCRKYTSIKENVLCERCSKIMNAKN